MTKKQIKINAEKAALRRRVLDIAFGAFGGYDNMLDVDPKLNSAHKGMFGEMSPDSIGRWIGAVHLALMGDKASYLLKPHSLEFWDDLDKLLNALYSAGVRA